MKKIYIFLFLYMIVNFTFSQNTLILNDDTKSIKLDEYISYLVVTNHDLFEEIYKNKNIFMIPDEREILNFGLTSDVYWLKIKIFNKSVINNWVLELNYPLMKKMELYIIKNNDYSNYIEESFDIYEKNNHRNFSYNLELENDEEIIIFIRFETPSTMRFPLYLHAFENYKYNLQKINISFGLYIGFVLGIAIIFFILFIAFKNKTYLYLFLFIFFYIFVDLIQNGTIFVFYNVQTDVYKMFSIFGILALIFLSLFAHNFLYEKNNHKLVLILNRLFYIIAFGSIVLILMAFIESKQAIVIYSVVPFIFLISNSYSVLRKIKGYKKSEKAFIISYLILVASIIIYSLRGLGLIANNFFTFYSKEIGLIFLIISLIPTIWLKMKEIIYEAKRSHELELQRNFFENENQIIKDSINYAKRIQHTILPKNKDLDKYLKEYFIIWKPKDIVGGDYYWFKKTDKGFLIAVIDCTGHGVPGALMTMTSNALLNRIVDSGLNNNPAVILNQLNKLMKNTLQYEKHEDIRYDDGLDIGLCYVNDLDKELIFSGAGISLYYDCNNKIERIIPNKQSIGYKRSKSDYEYNNYRIDIKDKIFFLCTDGFETQNGQYNLKSFSRKKLISLLEKNYNKELNYQKNIYELELENYMGKEPQRDDVTLIGFKIL